MLSGLISLKLNCLLFETYPSQWKPNINNNVRIVVRRGSTLEKRRGSLAPPDSLVAPFPRFNSQLTILTWFLRSQNVPKSKFSAPDPVEGAYSAPQTPYLMGRGLAPPAKNLTPALSPSGLVSTDLRVQSHYRVGNPTNDRFQMWAYMKFVFFRFRRTDKMDSMMNGQIGAMPPIIFGLEPLLINSCVSRSRSSSVSILSILQYMKTKKKTFVIITLVLWLWAWCLQCMCTCMCAFQSKQD